MRDLISREAAISAVEDHFPGTYYASSRTKAIKSLRDLPETQESTPAVKVKPLVWETPQWGDQTSQTPWGRYAVSQWRDVWVWSWNGDIEQAKTEYEAKAAAQADYEARILSALDTDK